MWRPSGDIKKIKMDTGQKNGGLLQGFAEDRISSSNGEKLHTKKETAIWEEKEKV